MLLTPEQISEFPVEHFSPSSIRKYLENPQSFFKSYIRYEWDESSSPALVEGKTMHKILECYYNGIVEGMDPAEFRWDESTDLAISESFTDEEVRKVDWGKTGSLEKSITTIRSAIESYRSELPKIEKVVSVEERYLTEFEDLEGVTMPIPLKGFTDLVTLQGDDYIIRDHKFVSFFVEMDKPEEIAKYEMAAVPYFFLVRKRYGKNPIKMIFDEVKKSKNRDGSPQRREVVIELEPKLINRWLEIYKRVVKSLAGIPLIDQETGMMQFLPNPFAQFGGEAWVDFCEEVDEGKVWTRDAIKEIRASKFSRPEEVEALF